MPRSIKAGFVMLVLSVCLLGAILSPREIPKDREPKSELVPVNNRQPHRIWLRV